MCVWALCACTPSNTTPVYNITITDNSQVVVGDNNDTTAKNDTDVAPKSEITNSADKTTSNMWIYWLIITISAVGFGYFYVKKKKFL